MKREGLSSEQFIKNPFTLDAPDIMTPGESYIQTLDVLFAGNDFASLSTAEIVLALDEFEEWISKYATTAPAERKDTFAKFANLVRDIQIRLGETTFLDMTPEIERYVRAAARELRTFTPIYNEIRGSEFAERTETEEQILPDSSFDPSWNTFAEVASHTRRMLLNVENHLSKSMHREEFEPVLEELGSVLEDMVAPYERYEDDRFTEEFTLVDIKAKLRTETWHAFTAMLHADRELYQIITGKDNTLDEHSFLIVGKEAMAETTIANVLHIALSRSLEDMYSDPDDTLRNAERQLVDEFYGENAPKQLEEERLHWELWLQEATRDITDEGMKKMAEQFFRSFRFGLRNFTMRNINKNRDIISDVSEHMPELLHALPKRKSAFDSAKSGDRLVQIVSDIMAKVMEDIDKQEKEVSYAYDTAFGNVVKREITQLFRSEKVRKERFQKAATSKERDELFAHQILSNMVRHEGYEHAEDADFVARMMGKSVWAYVDHIKKEKWPQVSDQNTGEALRDMSGWKFSAPNTWTNTPDTHGVPSRKRIIKEHSFYRCNLSDASFVTRPSENEHDEIDMHAVEFFGCNMRGVDMSQVHMGKCTTFDDCDLSKARFESARLTDAKIYNCILTEAEMIGTIIDRTVIQNSTLDRVTANGSLENSKLQNCVITNGTLRFINFNCTLSSVNFHGSKMFLMERTENSTTVCENCDFTDADLTTTDAAGITFTTCDMRRAKVDEMTNSFGWMKHYVDAEGRYDPQLFVEFMKTYPEKAQTLDYSGISLRGIDARGVRLRGRFVGADFREAQFDEMSLYGQNIEGANFEDAEGMSRVIQLGAATFDSPNPYISIDGYALPHNVYKLGPYSGVRLLHLITPSERLVGASLAGIEFGNKDEFLDIFSSHEYRGPENQDFTGVNFEGSTLTGLNFAGGTFVDVQISGTTFDQCTFVGANIPAELVNQVRRCELEGATIRFSDEVEREWLNWAVVPAKGDEESFVYSKAQLGSNIRRRVEELHADGKPAIIKLPNADLSGLYINLQGKDSWGRLIAPEANLQGAVVEGVMIGQNDLERTDLRKIDLRSWMLASDLQGKFKSTHMLIEAIARKAVVDQKVFKALTTE